MKTAICLEMRSVRSLCRPIVLLSAVKLQCAMLPEYLPQKFGWFEPLRKSFDPEHLDALIPPDCNGLADSVFWKRKGKCRAEGHWTKRWGKILSNSTHSSIALTVFDACYQDKLIAYLKAGSIENECDFGYLDGVPERYKPYAAQSDMAQGYSRLFITTHVLRHWLPDMLWATVFGPAYVRMFGKERLLSAPAYLVEDIGPEAVYIQLTENLEDIEEKFDEVMVAREKVKQHLGIEAFYRPELGYEWREHPEKAGRVFRVPEFQLLPD